jgi:hypothetical protein
MALGRHGLQSLTQQAQQNVAVCHVPTSYVFMCCAGQKLPMSGKVFISMADKYKADAVGIAKQLTDMGYGVVATRGTASTLMAAGKCHPVLPLGYCHSCWNNLVSNHAPVWLLLRIQLSGSEVTG